MYAFVATALIACVMGFGSAWQIQDWRAGALERDRLEQQARESVRRADKVDVAAVGHEADKKEIHEKFVVITQEVERVVKEPFYAGGDLCLDDAGLRDLSAAVGAPADAASQPARAVPGSRPAH